MPVTNPTHTIHPRLPRVLRTRSRAAALATSALLFAAGCGGDGPVAPGFGSGSVNASGAVTASGSGLAVFQSITSGTTSLFQLVIAPVVQTNTSWQLQIANYSGRPAAGTYNLSALSASSTNPTATF